MKMLTDHVVLITGGGSGLGLGLVHFCLRESAKVVVLDHSPENIARVAQLAQDDAEADLLLLTCDVRDVTALEEARKAVEDRFGRLSALICAHGIFGGNLPPPVVTEDKLLARFSELLQGNQLGSDCTARVFAELLERDKGTIVVTTSSADFVGESGDVQRWGAKDAVRNMVATLSDKYGASLRVSGVAPSGVIRTQPPAPQTDNSVEIAERDFLERLRYLMLEQELPGPELHGPLFGYLASRGYHMPSGQTVIVDQGVFDRPL